MFTWKLLSFITIAYFYPMKKTALLAAIGSLLLVGCGGEPASQNAPRSKAPEGTVEEVEDSRDNYFKPYEVFNSINGVGGKLVADMGAGDGYFTWKLINSGADVIAICDSQQEADALNAEKVKRELPDSRLLVFTRKSIEETGLGLNKVDLILQSGSIVGVSNPVDYASKLLNSMKPTGALMLFEWKPIESPIGPPVDTRYEEIQMMDILQAAGFTDVVSQSKILPYHFVFLGQIYQGEAI
jgi:2-polyprenyl-3-methyl-5-hydroxy-6-metoxy-1,4-benzoquinol methylase